MFYKFLSADIDHKLWIRCGGLINMLCGLTYIAQLKLFLLWFLILILPPLNVKIIPDQHLMGIYHY